MAGRFNRVNTAATYLAREPETAYLEYQAGNAEPLPVAIVAFRVRAERVIDLTSASDLQPPWLNWREDWKTARYDASVEPWSWRCADEALKQEASGIQFPSTVNPAGVNLVVYPEDASAGLLSLEIIDPARAIHAAMSRTV